MICCLQAIHYTGVVPAQILVPTWYLYFALLGHLFPGASHCQDMLRDSMPLSSRTTCANCVPADNLVPNLWPPSPETDCNALRISYDHDGQYKPHPVHSPKPQRKYILPYTYRPQGSRSSQDIGTLTVGEHDSDAVSISSQHSAKLLSAFVMSQHGLVRDSSHPEHCTSRPMEVSRTSTLASANVAPPDYSPSGSPPPLRIVIPISTASVQRWNRNIVMYVRRIHVPLL